jgi:hypothetical protein
MDPNRERDLNPINLTYVLNIKNVIKVTFYSWLNRNGGVIVQTLIFFVLCMVLINVVL